MTDRRVVDGLTIEELEQVIYIKRREARLARVRQRPQVQPTASRQNPRPIRPKTEPTAQLADVATDSQFAPVQAVRTAASSDPAEARSSGRSRLWNRVGDRVLLLVELAALLGLVLVVSSFLADIRTLNQETARVQANVIAAGLSPTAEPAFLPGGSTPPTLTSDVPAPFRDLIQAPPVVVIPTPGPQAATRLIIPAISVDAPVVEGDGWEELKKGVGHHVGSANPGERGNVVLSGHNDVFGEVFRRLTELPEGDEVQIMDSSGRTYRYRVSVRRIVEPTEVRVMDPTTDPILTLITCYPYLVDTQRLIVIAELIK